MDNSPCPPGDAVVVPAVQGVQVGPAGDSNAAAKFRVSLNQSMEVSMGILLFSDQLEDDQL